MAAIKTSLSTSDEKVILELLTILSWRLFLSPRPENEKKMYLALISINSVAKSIARTEAIITLVEKLPDFLTGTIDNHDFITAALDEELIEQRLRDCRQIFAQLADEKMQKSYADFIYHFAFKLAGLSGKSFAGMSSNVGAEDAETLFLIRSELGC